MKMILAVNNNALEEKLTFKYFKKYEIYIATSKEIVFNLSNTKEKTVVIIKEDIRGNISFKSLITALKTKDNIEIIVLVKKLTIELKEWLLSKEVFNIIEGNKFKFEELTEVIDNPRMIIYKESEGGNINKKVIFVTGSKGTGKTITSILIANEIAKNKEKKICVIDMDFIYPSIDTYLDLDLNYSLTDYIKDVIDNNIKSMGNYETEDKNNSNLKYILNSKSIGIPKDEIIINMISRLEEKYDYIIVDTSSMIMNKVYKIAMEKSYTIVHVINVDKKANKEFVADTLYIDKLQLCDSLFICNKYKKIFGYDFKRNNKIYDYNILGYVKYDLLFEYKRKIKINKIQKNITKVMKNIGIDKYRKFKEKIYNKFLS